MTLSYKGDHSYLLSPDTCADEKDRDFVKTSPKLQIIGLFAISVLLYSWC